MKKKLIIVLVFGFLGACGTPPSPTATLALEPTEQETVLPVATATTPLPTENVSSSPAPTSTPVEIPTLVVGEQASCVESTAFDYSNRDDFVRAILCALKTPDYGLLADLVAETYWNHEVCFAPGCLESEPACIRGSKEDAMTFFKDFFTVVLPRMNWTGGETFPELVRIERNEYPSLQPCNAGQSSWDLVDIGYYTPSREGVLIDLFLWIGWLDGRYVITDGCWVYFE